MFGKIPLRISALWVIGAWISYQVFELVFNSNSDVSWGAHVGGIVMGAILILFMRRSGVRLLDQNVEGKLSSRRKVETDKYSFEDEISTDAVERALTKPNPTSTQTPSQPSALPPSPWGRGGDGN
jgi:hypothetical protein